MFKNLTNHELVKIGTSGLTQNEINSFKYGNEPTEETRLKSALQKTYVAIEAKTHRNNEHLPPAYLQKKIVGEYLKVLDSVNTLEELEDLRILGFGGYK